MNAGRELRGAPGQARYDGFAEWSEQWIGDKPPLLADYAGYAREGERRT